ncbi:anti-sigma factor [Massilia sp. NEAU-DD11]|uniref:Anti-sigma factor n=1 Tax=Massilia cellulosiltytica TaxID=2683234 RepID=A0A7X3G5L0_9BURK|nr:anti-sigma factor [Telluria cellulosilytica]MVW64116.1 anti-sigma factor [Telluria cellulosilytica]
MTYSDDTLMAYADGELEAAERAAIEQAMRTDPAIAAAVERHRALRADVAAAFAGILDEPVPARLRPPAPVVSLAVERDKRRRWSWPEWGALAATLVVGVLAGRMIPGGGGPAIAGNGNQVLAQGELAAALDRQVGGKAEGAVKVGVSFAARDGAYCRGFVMGASAGLACREGGQWKIPVLAEAEKEAAGGYRQAGSALPPAVLDAIDARIADKPLDAAGEEAARARGWRPAR